jgi:D-alanyl-lipoteichoic acid acyltransferase DltB (MBOAT superfamily)
MLFDSLEVTYLYLCAIALLFLQRKLWPAAGIRQWLLLAANLLILSTLLKPETLIAVAVAALGSFGAAWWFQRCARRGVKLSRLWPGACLLALTGMLVILKYDWARQALGDLGLIRGRDLIETLGLSYVYFKLVHSLSDACRGRLVRLNPVTYLNYILFFPTYLSGPIDRYQNFAGWVNRPGSGRDRLLRRAAFFRLFMGVAKKFILVPLLVGYATDVNQVQLFGAYWLNLTVSLFAYSFYLYFDFSGYSDLAIGVAMLLGFRVPENFRNPYLAVNISDFWRRWHISFSSILREYVFLPLVRGLSKRLAAAPRLPVSCAGYLITFVICGLWHGNTANFAVWGLWHGIGLSVYKIWSELPLAHKLRQVKRGWLKPVLTGASIGLTFIFVSAGWLFFNYTFAEIRSLREIARWELSARPCYFYGDYYTWGVQLKYKPAGPDDRIDFDLWDVAGKRWVPYHSGRLNQNGLVNVYGIEGGGNDPSLASLTPGDYELRIRYREAGGTASDPIRLAVKVPDYSVSAGFTADDLRAEARRLAGSGWGIRLSYRPPAPDFTVDIEYRPPGGAVWIPHQYQRPGRYHFAVLSGTGRNGEPAGLKPGVHCVRIRYTNMAKGYFSDWTELAVRVPVPAGPNETG